LQGGHRLGRGPGTGGRFRILWGILRESQVPRSTFSMPMGGLEALQAVDEELGTRM
jgi:hypothetical protein